MLPTLDLGQNVKTMGRASVKFYKGSSWVGKQIAKGHKQTQDVSGMNVGN
ncbi:hypothetical protein [Spiroplasma ixodetis]|nr:hypothetical protein [Spiroplasma ixodetis]